jgi:hypothetical protein
MRRAIFLGACAFLALTPWLPARAHGAAPGAAAGAPISFAEYRDFRLQIIDRRREMLAMRLAAPDLATKDKASLERQKAYYDRWAKMAADVRDRLFRERFDDIDTDHDGTIDAQERAAWHARQQAYYRELALLRARDAASH